MSFHPNPMSMAVHVEHHRQELLAKEAITSAMQVQDRQGRSDVKAAVANRARSLFSRLRPALAQPLELSQSSPGEAR
jgi:hypothetical protein